MKSLYRWTQNLFGSGFLKGRVWNSAGIISLTCSVEINAPYLRLRLLDPGFIRGTAIKGKKRLDTFFSQLTFIVCFSQGAKGNVGAPGSRGEPGFPVSYPTNISYLKQIKFAFVFTIILCNSYEKVDVNFLTYHNQTNSKVNLRLHIFHAWRWRQSCFWLVEAFWSWFRKLVSLFFTLRQTQQKTHLRIVCLELNKKSINLFNRDFSSFQGLEGSAGISGEAGHSGNQVRRTL